MNPVILDCSVAVSWFIKEEHSGYAMAVLEHLRKQSTDLAAPSLLSAEFGNVIWKKVKNGLLNEKGAKSQLVNFMLLPVKYFPMQPLLPLAFSLAHRQNITVYDCMYLSLALNLKSPIATSDEKLKKVAAKLKIKLFKP